MALAEKVDDRAAGAVRSNEPCNADFRFIPKQLAEKCRELIESSHAMSHYPCLADMLWHRETRDFIELNKTLLHVFRKASISRSAKKANQAYALIATVILSLEVLARDYAGWGRRFPSAKRQADALIGEFRPNSHGWLIDLYMYPRFRSRSTLTSALALTDEWKSQPVAGSSEFIVDEEAASATDGSIVLARRSPSPA
jgi:hypothetical protein